MVIISIIMKIIVRLLLVPAIIMVVLTWTAGAIGICRAIRWGDPGQVVESSAIFGANSALLFGLLMVFRRLRVPSKRTRRVFGSRTMRLGNVGASPRIALF